MQILALITYDIFRQSLDSRPEIMKEAEINLTSFSWRE
jgi:hypothetical protein